MRQSKRINKEEQGNNTRGEVGFNFTKHKMIVRPFYSAETHGDILDVYLFKKKKRCRHVT